MTEMHQSTDKWKLSRVTKFEQPLAYILYPPQYVFHIPLYSL